MSVRLFRRLAAPVAFPIAWSAPLLAQSRTDEIAKQQEAKAQTATPYDPNRMEVFLDQARFTPNHLNRRLDLEGSIAVIVGFERTPEGSDTPGQ